jgi:hypothetical protein
VKGFLKDARQDGTIVAGVGQHKILFTAVNVRPAFPCKRI